MKQWALKKLGHYVSEEVKHVRNVSFTIYLIGNFCIYTTSLYKIGARALIFLWTIFWVTVTDLSKYPTALTKQARRVCIEYALNCHLTTVQLHNDIQTTLHRRHKASCSVALSLSYYCLVGVIFNLRETLQQRNMKPRCKSLPTLWRPWLTSLHETDKIEDIVGLTYNC